MDEIKCSKCNSLNIKLSKKEISNSSFIFKKYEYENILNAKEFYSYLIDNFLNNNLDILNFPEEGNLEVFLENSYLCLDCNNSWSKKNIVYNNDDFANFISQKYDFISYESLYNITKYDFKDLMIAKYSCFSSCILNDKILSIIEKYDNGNFIKIQKLTTLYYRIETKGGGGFPISEIRILSYLPRKKIKKIVKEIFKYKTENEIKKISELIKKRNNNT